MQCLPSSSQNKGAIKLITAGIPQCPSDEPLEVEYETKLSARINGNQVYAQCRQDKIHALRIVYIYIY